MVENATAMGADIAHMALGILLLVGCFKFGDWVYHRTRRLLVGWAAGLALFAASALIFGPLMANLTVVKCRSDADPELCEGGTYRLDY